jgi:hypothetical protein
MTTSNAVMNPYTRTLLPATANTQTLRPAIEKAKSAQAASKKPVSQHLIERAKEMNARIRLRKIEAEPAPVAEPPSPPANGQELLHLIGHKWQAGRHVWRELRAFYQLTDEQPITAQQWKGVQTQLLALGYSKPSLARQSWRSFDFSGFDLQAIGAAYASGTPLRKLIPAEVPGYIFSEKLNSLGFKKGGK